MVFLLVLLPMVLEMTDPRWIQLQECSYPPTNHIKYRSILVDAFWQGCFLLHGECQTSDCHGNSRELHVCHKTTQQTDLADLNCLRTE